MKEVCISYGFHQHEVRVWCKTNGADGRIVLEDILKILHPNNWESLLERKIDLVRDEVTTRTFREDNFQKTVYVAETSGAKDFCAFCDDANDQELFNEFYKWLDEKCRFIDDGMAHMAETHPKFKATWEYVARVTEEGKANLPVTIDKWLSLEYGIELPWLRSPITGIIKLLMAYGRRLLTGEPLPKTDNGANQYHYRDFGEVFLEVNRLVAGEAIYDKHNYKEKLKSIINSSAQNGRKNDALKEEEKVIPLLEAHQPDDEIISELWKTSQASSPHQYTLLKFFLEVVRERQRRTLRR